MFLFVFSSLIVLIEQQKHEGTSLALFYMSKNFSCFHIMRRLKDGEGVKPSLLAKKAVLYADHEHT